MGIERAELVFQPRGGLRKRRLRGLLLSGEIVTDERGCQTLRHVRIVRDGGDSKNVGKRHALRREMCA
jgi:hypothetical protein